jgi:hypothetical protein
MTATAAAIATAADVRRKIPADFEAMWKGYPAQPFNTKEGLAIKAVTKQLEDGRLKYNEAHPDKPIKGAYTPCCFQVSEALHQAGIVIPDHSVNRSNQMISGRPHLATVNEVIAFLTQRFFAGEAMHGSTAQVQKALLGRTGIVTFGGMHVELWDGSAIRQLKFMHPGIWNNGPIRFWDVEPHGQYVARPPLPRALLGWWKVTDPGVYYYYFESDGMVFYSRTPPPKPNSVPSKAGINYGRVSTLPTSPFGIRIDWNPVDGGVTIEKFFEQPAGGPARMAGTSNRPPGSRLDAVKLA